MYSIRSPRGFSCNTTPCTTLLTLCFSLVMMMTDRLHWVRLTPLSPPFQSWDWKSHRVVSTPCYSIVHCVFFSLVHIKDRDKWPCVFPRCNLQMCRYRSSSMCSCCHRWVRFGLGCICHRTSADKPTMYVLVCLSFSVDYFISLARG